MHGSAELSVFERVTEKLGDMVLESAASQVQEASKE